MPREEGAWVRGLPDWAKTDGEKKGLEDVVSAIEKAHVCALISALDKVDAELLNRHVQLKWSDQLGDRLGVCDNPVLFKAHAVSDEMGRLPCSLLACLLFVLSDTTYNNEEVWAEELFDQRAPPPHTNDEWVAVVTALVNHPKMDVNTVVTIEQHWQELIAYERRAHGAAQSEPGEPVAGPDFGWNEDCMSAWDYLMEACLESQSSLGASHPVAERGRRLLCVLASSGKLDMGRQLHMYYGDNVHDQGPFFTPLWAAWQLEFHDVFKAFLSPRDDKIMPHVWKFHQERMPKGGDHLPCNQVPYAAIRARIGRYHHKIWRRIVRVHILLGRMWRETRDRLYVPGARGAKLARLSFEAQRDHQ